MFLIRLNHSMVIMVVIVGLDLAGIINTVISTDDVN